MAIKFEEKSAAKPGDRIKKSFEFAIKRNVTTPVLSIKGGGTYFVIPIEHPIAKVMTTKKGAVKLNDDGTPASMKIIKVFDYEDDEVKSLILPAVAYSDLKLTYPKGFLGCFLKIEIPKDKAEGKNYKQCKVKELFPPDEVVEILAKMAPPIDLKELQKLNVLTPNFWKELDQVDIETSDIVEED